MTQLTDNEKLYQKVLPKSGTEVFVLREYEAPEGEIETALAGIWAEVLQVKRVGRRDNFFVLGGRSLLALQVAARVRQALGVDIDISLFAMPVLSDFARVVESARQSWLPAITHAERGQRLPLSFAQRGLWFLAQMEGGSEAYHISFGVRLRGELNVAALKQALDRIVARHEALRTTFAMVDGEPEQRIVPVEESRFQLQEQDLREHEDAGGELERVIAEEAGAGFDLERGPLIRGRLIRLGEEEHALLISMHHIVSDGWSLGVLFKEMSELYGAYVEGEADPLPELGVQYADYAVWQRKWMEGEVLGEQAEYWKRNLAGAPEVLELPADHVRPARQDYAGAVVPVRMNEKLTAGLKELSGRQGTTLYMTLLAGWAVLLSRLSGQQDVVIGTPVANRGRVEIENLIGDFVNMLVLRVDVSGRPTVGEMLGRVKRQAVAAQQHQDIPFEQVVELVQPVRSLAHSPLFQVTFTWLEGLEDRPQLPGLMAGSLQLSPHRVSKFDLALLIRESEGRIEGVAEYATALFEAETVERYLGYFTRLLKGMMSEERETVDHLPLLGEAERRQVVEQWNQTEAKIPTACIHELFEEQVEKRPEAVAVSSEDQQLSYGELNARANRLAHYLQRLGVGVETRVGVCLERSVEMIVAILGILKAGGAYVPLDGEYPAERLVFMLEDAEVGLVLTKTGLRDRLSAEATRFVLVVCLDAEGEAIAEESWENVVGLETDSSRLAYVMYTSGSTGRPKGVMVTQENVVRLVRSTNYVEFGSGVVIGHVSNVVFDASTFEIWGALLNGGRLAVIAKTDVLAAPEVLGGQLKELGVTTLFLTTALFQECVRSYRGIFAGMDQILFGGEVCDAECVRQSVEQEGPREVVHVYGPTETTTFASYLALKRVEQGKAVPIGQPIGNTKIYILDRELETVGVGIPGEIYVGGLGVARCYANRPEMTAERFVPNPFSDRRGERLYRTGDLGRWHVEGTIEFVGRRDEQVKVRGFRIELGEVEGALREQAGVKEAVAIAWVKDSGDKQLVGYVVGEKGAMLTAAGVREGVGKKLPEYMVPMVVVMEELPLTANGKVDRRHLPKPEEMLEERTGEYVRPRNRTEAILAEVWEQALGLERVGVEENFFELGGDSILSVRIIGWARERGLEFSVQDLFEYQTIAALAGVVRRENGEERIVTAPYELVGEEVRSCLPEDVEDAYPLSQLQAGMLFHSGYVPESSVYHDVITYRLCLPYEAKMFQRALDRLTQQHEMLRTSIDMASFSEPIQLVHRRVDLRVLEQDWRGKSAGEQEAGLADFMERECRTGFEWNHGPLMRMFVHRLSADEFQCSFSFNHAIMDGWSEASLITELVQDYECRLAGGSLDIRPLGVSYRDYIALERRAMAAEESITFWKQMLQGHMVTPVPLRDWLGEETPASSAEMLVRVIEMGEDTQDRLRHLARENETPLKTVLLAAHMKALQVLTGQSDVTTGVVLNGRPEVNGGEQVLGLFLNTVPFRLRMECSSWRSLIRETFAAEQQILPHRRFPMVDLREQMGGEALFQTTFNYVHFHVYRELERDGQQGRRLIGGRSGYARTSLDFLVNFEVAPDTGKLQGTVHCHTGIMGAAALERVANYYQNVLEGMTEDRIGDVRPEGERSQIEKWNRTEAEIPGGCVHELFEEQVEKMPEAVALEYEGQQLTYAELNRRANQLAHYLQGLGVGPDVLVGVCLERSLEMVLALLGVLKAGGAYVPLDPAYPVERLRFMIEDSAPAALLTQSHLEKLFVGSDDSLPVLDLASATPPWQEHPETNPAPDAIGLGPQHLAYVIYTSGSTGTAKGVLVTHLNVVRLVQNTNYVDFTPPLTIGHLSNVAFDAATFEVWGALLNGCRLAVIPRFDVLVPENLAVQLQNLQVSTLFLTTALFNECIRQQPNIFHRMDQILFGGELCDPQSVRQALQKSPQRGLFHVYGPTETTTFASHFPIETVRERSTVPIGRPIANTRIYILDAHGEPVPVGVTGELYIGGSGVARGYLNRPELTAEKFLKDPFTDDANGRMYRTGDLGRWQADGAIQFVGRNDFQVKVRGFRIELGEIEVCLLHHRCIREAVVVAREESGGEKRLVAYYTVKEGAGQEEVGAEELRGYLSGKLPEYMVPAAYVRLESLPLTPNGKLDRKGLPAPEGDAYAVERYEAPEGEIETIVAGIWEDVLKVEPVGRRDNFFALGGHSLLVVRATSRIQQALGVEVRISDVFACPVLSDFARVVESARQSRLPAITRAERGGRVPLSFAQQRLWFLAQMEGGSKAYHMPFDLRLNGRLNRAALKRTLDRIVARHEALRTTFLMVNEEPEQRIAPVEESRFHLLEHDLRQHPDANGELERVIAEEAGAGFDLERGPLIRGRLIRLGEEEHALLISMHHIVSDGWSLGVLFKEMSELYGAYVRGEEDRLPELGVQYADYAVWQRKWMEGEV
ncbi:MAG TPA: amino acid adenylation domain-containing protein, partial [Candidatus Angelobacter sp.]